MSIRKEKIKQITPDVMTHQGRSEEIIVYIQLAVSRLLEKKDAEGFKSSLRQHLCKKQRYKRRQDKQKSL